MDLLAPRPGDRVGGFEIQVVAGRGGMGSVYRAATEDGRDVALKLVAIHSEKKQRQFEREVDALARLEHPGVVRYLDHGAASGPWQWLAMEWLDGEDLASRLRRRETTFVEVKELASALADALTHVHAAGLVHRDLKPSNIYCCTDGAVKLIDFGITEARGVALKQGAGPGTPGYMAPEQARGGGHVDERTDLFALGCVLFEAVTGRPAFVSRHRAGTLARVVLEEVPRCSELRPNTPGDLDELVHQLLRKEPNERPAAARAVHGRCASMSLRPPAVGDSTPPPDVVDALGEDEQQLVCVIMAVPPEGYDTTLDTQTETEELWEPDHIAELAVRAGAQIEYLADGTALLYSSGSVASDLVRRSAECARALAKEAPGVSVVLSTGRALLGGRWPVGDAVDSAARRLAMATTRVGSAGVLIDELSAELLRASSGADVVSGDTGAAELLTRSSGQSLRRVRLVSRDEELNEALRLLQPYCSGGAAQHIVVHGEAGIGKSVFATELLAHLPQELQVLRAGASPLHSAVPFGLAAQLVRAAAGDERGATEHAALGERQAAFLSELLAPGAAKSPHAAVRAARRDPAEMREGLTDAWLAWLAAEAGERPLLLIVDDLQWGDEPSAELLSTLTENSPAVSVVWLARTGEDPRLPPTAPRIALSRLPDRAATDLVRAQLGLDADDTRVRELVEQAAGHPLFLEELARATTRGQSARGATTPLAMLQATLSAFPDEVRRALRAAAVLGRSFDSAGVARLAGPKLEGRVDRVLKAKPLSRVVLRDGSQRGHWRFAHDLWREAAYSLLTEEDRVRGHRLAGLWLETQEHADATILAEHFSQGKHLERAGHWLVRAAELAIGLGDFASAERQLDQCDTTELPRRTAAEAKLARAELLLWKGKLDEATEAAQLACQSLPADSQRWARAAALVMQTSGRLGKLDVVRDITTRCDDNPEAIWLWCQAAREQVRGGDYAAAEQLLERIAPSIDAADHALVAEYQSLLAARALHLGDFVAQAAHWKQALAAYEALGQRAPACGMRGELGFASYLVGDQVAAKEAMETALAEAQAHGFTHIEAWLQCVLGPVLAELGQFEAGIAAERAALRSFERVEDPRLAGASWAYLAVMQAEAALDDRGKSAAHTSCKLLESFPPLHVLALTAAARAALAAGDPDAANTQLQAAKAQLAEVEHVEEGEALLWLTEVEVLDALGQTAAATRVAQSSLLELERRAAKLGSEAARSSFFTGISSHRKLRARAREAAGTT